MTKFSKQLTKLLVQEVEKVANSHEFVTLEDHGSLDHAYDDNFVKNAWIVIPRYRIEEIKRQTLRDHEYIAEKALKKLTEKEKQVLREDVNLLWREC